MTEHSDDIAIDKFATAMKEKMKFGREVRNRGGWEECSEYNLATMMIDHAYKGDPVDVANFAMMIWSNGHKTTRATVTPSEIGITITEQNQTITQSDKCKACNGNDGDVPCAYPSSNVKGCLRDVRLNKTTSDKAAALEALEYYIDDKRFGNEEAVSDQNWEGLLSFETCETIRAALQQPDDGELVNILCELLESGSEFYPSAIEANVSDNPPNFDCEKWFERANKILAKNKAKVQG